MNKLISEYLRPQSFDDLTMPSRLKERLIKMHETKNVMNMLFYGKPGSGKTTAAKIFTNSEHFECIELNGSLETSVEGIRNKVMNFASSASMFESHKICFIDEADYLSKNAQAGLRNLIEKTSDNCRFIFTANDLSKIHPALCSRLFQVSFDMTSSQTSDAIQIYIKRTILKLKEISNSIDESRVKRIIELNYPDFRIIANQLEFEFM